MPLTRVSIDNQKKFISKIMTNLPNKSTEKPLLEVKGLKTYFFTRGGTVKAVGGETNGAYERGFATY
jgi:hypothetical protein